MSIQLAELFSESSRWIENIVTVNGWVKTCRPQKELIFIAMSDGTTQKQLQVVCSAENCTNFADLPKITTGTSIRVSGKVVKSPAKGQDIEMSASDIHIYQVCSPKYPLQKVGLPLEFMRQLPHLRHRSNIMRAVFTVKSKIMESIHKFFIKKNFCYVDLPVLTTNACEGGCEPLQVTSLLKGSQKSTDFIDSLRGPKITDIPTIKSVTNTIMTSNGPSETITSSKLIDFKQDFFDNPVYLTVSNQLHLECFAHGMGYVYTITPATRGEPSQSTKHLAHFNMLEYEFCFGDLDSNIDLAEGCIKFCVEQVIAHCQEELAILNKFSEDTLLPKLQKISSEKFVRIEHKTAIFFLRKVHQDIPFTDEPKYDGDLSGEHERFLVKHFDQPVVVMRYPKAVKAFYMPVCRSEIIDGKTIEYVDCYDLLMDIGEVVGGSQRISDEQTLIDRMNEQKIDLKHLDWYIDLRRYGSVPHGGCGMGIERLVAVLTGMANVKDCISFPLSVHYCKY
jgi:asparaginyl-tRNA synthetase